MLSARAMKGSTDEVLMTKEGHEQLVRELQELTTLARRELGERVRDAREAGGNPAENGELMDALDEMAALERRIGELTGRLAMARIAEPPAGGGVAAIGTRVAVRTGDGNVLQYDLVGPGEADPARSRISIGSPIGAAIAGHRAGDQILVETPRGTVRFELVSVGPLEDKLAKAA